MMSVIKAYNNLFYKIPSETNKNNQQNELTNELPKDLVIARKLVDLKEEIDKLKESNLSIIHNSLILTTFLRQDVDDLKKEISKLKEEIETKNNCV
jgi:hypothetical protein